jgi:hypothetical protein
MDADGARARLDVIKEWIEDEIPMEACGFHAARVLEHIQNTRDAIDTLQRNYPSVV